MDTVRVRLADVRTRVRAVRSRIAVVDPVAKWWSRQRVWVKALVCLGLLAIAVAYPYTLSRYWQSVLFYPVAVYVILALGPEHRGRGGRAVGPRVRGVLRGGRLHHGAAHHQGGLGRVGGAARRHRRGDGGRGRARRAHPAATRRLPRHRDARLRRDRPHRGAEQRTPRGRPAASRASSTRDRSRAPNFELLPLPYYYLTLAAILLFIVVVVRLNRSRVGRSWAATPRGRGRRRGHGRPDVHDEALGLRHGRRPAGASPAGSTPARSASSTPTRSRSSCR